MNLVLATDGNSHSERATEVAISLARSLSARLVIVSVLRSRVEANEKVIEEVRSTLEVLRERADAAGVVATTMVEVGDPGPEIVALARRTGADMVIVGTSGKNALDRLVIGSVSEHVVRNANCTVIVAR